jgi:hypothetical protein
LREIRSFLDRPGFLLYFISILAPASSNFALISSASAFDTHFLTSPPLSAKSLPSFNQSPVTSLITLITAIFDDQALVKTTSNEVFSSPSAAGQEPAAPATTTGAAALTPNSSSIAVTNSFNSTIVKSLTASIIC